MNKRNVGLVIKYEIVSMLRKPSFWFFTFVFPVMIMAFSFLPQVFAQRSITEASSALVAASRGPATPYVDAAGILQNIPEDMKAGFRAYTSEDEAKAALESGEIPHYFLIPADFRETGKVIAVSEHPSPIAGLNGMGPLEYVLRLNLALGSGTLASGTERVAAAAALAAPIARMDERNLAPAAAAEARQGRPGKLYRLHRAVCGDVHPLLHHHDERRVYAAERDA